MYIKLKDKSLSKRVEEFLEKNDIKYFTSLDGENLKYAILYIPNNFKEENFNEINDLVKDFPISRIGTPDDIADLVIYLENAGYVTGQVIQVNGGWNI